MSVAENIDFVRNRVDTACRSAGRSADEIKLVAVTKTVGSEKIEEAIAAGVSIIGENRVQEAWKKYQAVERSAQWHMIGHLQRNKVRRCLRFSQMIQSVDSVRLAREINAEAEKLQRAIDVLIEVNTSGEESKFGFAPDETAAALAEIAHLSKLQVKGLMTIGAFSSNRDVVRRSFSSLRELRDRLQNKGIAGIELRELSMGMTNDFEVAIEEGSTMVRIGRLIFGERT